MVIPNGYSTPQHHRQNRRRERPGSRTRRGLTRGKANLHEPHTEDISATYTPIPSDKPRPSPLLRQNFDQSWQRWKCRQQTEEREKALLAQGQLKSSCSSTDGSGSEEEFDDDDDDEDVSAIPQENMERVLRLLFGGGTDYIDP